MGRNKESSHVDERIVLLAEKDLEFLPDGAVAMRLLAIISAGRGLGLDEIATFLRTTRQSVAKWIRKYKNDGLQGIRDRPKGHRKKRLSRTQEEQIQGWLDQSQSPAGEPYHWTVDKIKIAIEEQFGVEYSRSRVGYLIQEWGFKPKVPRPKHTQSDKTAQEAFKKTLRTGSRNPKHR
jgi:putative transposase